MQRRRLGRRDGRMGRIDSPAGRKMAALEAAEGREAAAPRKEAAAIEAAKAAKEAAKQAGRRKRPRKQAKAAASRQGAPEAAAASAAAGRRRAASRSSRPTRRRPARPACSAACASASANLRQLRLAVATPPAVYDLKGLNCPLPVLKARSGWPRMRRAAGCGWRPPTRWPSSTSRPSATNAATGWSKRRRSRAATVFWSSGRRMPALRPFESFAKPADHSRDASFGRMTGCPRPAIGPSVSDSKPAERPAFHSRSATCAGSAASRRSPAGCLPAPRGRACRSTAGW